VDVQLELAYPGAMYLVEVELPRTELAGRAWHEAGRADDLLDIGQAGARVLDLPIPDSDPVVVALGVRHSGAVYDAAARASVRAELRPGGVWARVTGAEPLTAPGYAALAEHLDALGYDRVGTPWANLTADGPADVCWPVRPTRDTPTFIGRHGLRPGIADPHGGLARARESADIYIDGPGELIGDLEAGTATGKALDGIWLDALKAAASAWVLGADGAGPAPADRAAVAATDRWLVLAARAGLAELTIRATGREVQVELDGHELRIPGPVTRDQDSRIAAAAMAALATGDPAALEMLRALPEWPAPLGESTSAKYTRLQLTALRALARGGRQAGTAVRAVLAEATARSDWWGVGPWFTEVEAPAWRLAAAFVDGDDAAFAEAHREALLAHRHWWAECQQNAGEPQDHLIDALLCLPVTGFAALHAQAGGAITIRSEYVPDHLLEAAAARPAITGAESPPPPDPLEEPAKETSAGTLVADLLALARTGSYNRVQEAVPALEPDVVSRLIVAYRGLVDPQERVLTMAALFHGAPLVQGRPVYSDIVASGPGFAATTPPPVDLRFELSTALAGLELDRARFDQFMTDDAAFDAAMARHLSLAVPIGQSTDGQTAETPAAAAPRGALRGLFARKPRPPEPADVNEIVRGALLRAAQGSLRRSGRPHQLGTDLMPGLPAVTCHPAELANAIVALIDNAATALPGSTRRELDLRTLTASGTIVIVVADTGPGVPAHLRDQILDPSYRPGRGLLSVRATIVEELGGSIGFTTDPGQGTTMIVRLPYPRRAGPPDQSVPTTDRA